MAVSPTYPGVYITETAAVPHVITAAPTNLTAIIGAFPQGPTGSAVLVTNWAEFEAQFGGLTASSSLAAYAVWQFFQNGGIGAWIVRLTVPNSAQANATIGIPQVSQFTVGNTTVNPNGPTGELTIHAKGPGAWANGIQVGLNPAPSAADPHGTHATFVLQPPPGLGAKQPPPPLETVPNVALLEPDGQTAMSATQIANEITTKSSYITATANPSGSGAQTTATLGNGSDGSWPTDTPESDTSFATVFAGAITSVLAVGGPLDQIAPSLFNIMCIPDLALLDQGTQVEVFATAYEFCTARQAFLLVDPPGPSLAFPTPAITVDDIGAPSSSSQEGGQTPMQTLVNTWASGFLSPANGAAATYYPWLEITDPATGLPRYVPPSGTIAGVYASTDTTRGVWKAPAGTEAVLRGVTALADTTINDTINGELNVLGINCLRVFPIYGSVVWGSRTLAGADVAGSPFKYVPVRRLADFIEQSLQQSLRWAVFEPNGPALWASISLEVTAFMAGLFGAGAFYGAAAPPAYTVTCDASTTSPTDMLSGIVNVNVGFVPVDPAEFVMLNVQINAASPAS